MMPSAQETSSLTRGGDDAAVRTSIRRWRPLITAVVGSSVCLAAAAWRMNRSSSVSLLGSEQTLSATPPVGSSVAPSATAVRRDDMAATATAVTASATAATASSSSLRRDKTRAATSSSSSSQPAPHIWFILADDLGWNDVGYQSTDLGACTPTIDALAREGVRLHAYYAMDQCTPSRSSLLSGTYPVNTGMWHGSILADNPFGLPLDFTLLPEWLKTVADYNTQAVGKWDVGHFTPAYLPTSRGFDGFLGYYGTSSVVAPLLPTTKRAPIRAWHPRDLAPHGSRGDLPAMRESCE